MSAEVAAADGQIKRGAQIVATSKSELDAELKSLESKLSSVGSMWVGQGATAFTQLMARWREDATKIVSALDEFEQNLLGSDKDYTASDDEQSSTFSNLQGRLAEQEGIIMGDLKVNFGGVATAASDISSGANNVEAKLNDMDSQLQPLKANWTGEAASSYEAARAKWGQALTDMKQLLAEIATAVQTSGEQYQSTEKRNASRW